MSHNTRKRINPLGRGLEQLEAREVPATVTLANPTDLTVDSSTDTRSVTYLSGTHFAFGSYVKDVKVTIQFQKDYLNSGNPFNNEIHYSLTSPDGTTVEIIPADMWPSGDVESGIGAPTKSSGKVTMTFTDAASKAVAGTFQPTNGTFRPFNAFSAFAGSSPIGTWTLNVQDTVEGDPLFHYDVKIAVTANVPRFDMKASSGSPAVDGWEKVWQGTKYSATRGFGWSASSFVGGAAGGLAPPDTNPAVMSDYAYGVADATFQVYVGPYHYSSVTIYSYGTELQGTTGSGVAVRIGDGPTETLNANGEITLGGWAGADGILNINLSRRTGGGLWVVSAIEIDPKGQG